MPLFNYIFIITFYLITIYIIILVTFFYKLLSTYICQFCVCLIYTYLFIYFIFALLNLINCAKVRYLQSFVFIFAFKAKLKDYLYIVIYFDIAKHINIIETILKRVKPSRKDIGWR